MSTEMELWLSWLGVSLVSAPLLPGIINRTKAFFAGRKGPSIFQLYFDLIKQLRKGSVLSTASGGLLKLVPCGALALLLAASLLMPHGRLHSPLAWSCDWIVFFYLLGTSRLLMVLAAREAGSSFEDMGASREVEFALIVEAVIFTMICFLLFSFEQDSLSKISLTAQDYVGHMVSHLLTAMAFFIVMLAENCRVPVDDPETHLELTMIHEAMILDYSGPDLALVQYGAALKLWLFSMMFVLLAVPETLLRNSFIFYGEILATGVLAGIVESCMARFRFLKVPQFLLAALGLVLLGLFFGMFLEQGVLEAI